MENNEFLSQDNIEQKQHIVLTPEQELARQQMIQEAQKKIATTKVELDQYTSVLDEGTTYAAKAVSQWLVISIDSCCNGDVNVQDRLNKQAQKTVENSLDTIDKKIQRQQQDANFKANEAACNSYGIEKTCPIWLTKVMRAGYNFWSLIYSIIAFLTIVPVNIFFQGISHFIKKNWIALLLALFIYLVLFVALPIICSYFGINYWWK